jgi:hypothetical protein
MIGMVRHLMFTIPASGPSAHFTQQNPPFPAGRFGPFKSC